MDIHTDPSTKKQIAKRFFIFQELQKAGSMGSAEPNFFRFSSKSVLFSAKILQNFIKFYESSLKLTKVYQLYQI